MTSWNDRPLLVSALRDDLAGLDPRTGSVVWRTPSFGSQAKASPVAGEGIVVLAGGKDSSEVAVRLGGSGDVTESHVLWRRDPAKSRIATGIVHDGYIYGVQTPGIADCVNLETGEFVWEQRLRGPGASTAVWSSPMMAGDRIYVMNQSGDVFVYKTGPKYQLLSINSMEETSNSSVVASQGSLFLRTHQALWHIGSD